MATSLAVVLSQIRWNESHDSYNLTPQQNYDYPRSHASGAYQFQPGTWRQWTAASGVGTQYNEAYQAPPGVQDQVAAYAALHGPGVNSTALWGASAPAGGYPTPTNDGMPITDSGGTVTPSGSLGTNNSYLTLDDPTLPFDYGNTRGEYGVGQETDATAGATGEYGVGQAGTSGLNDAAGLLGGLAGGTGTGGGWFDYAATQAVDLVVRFGVIVLGLVLVGIASYQLAKE